MRRESRILAITVWVGTTLGYAADVPAPPEVPYENAPYNGKFTFARVKFNPSEWGPGRYKWGLDLKWNHDYPRADEHFLKILRETTTIDPMIDDGATEDAGDPFGALIRNSNSPPPIALV